MIKHIGSFNDNETEGFMKISKVIMNSITYDKNIYHFHSSGFGLSILGSIKKIKNIYSLYTNLNNSLFIKLKTIRLHFKMFGIKDRKQFFKNIFFIIISSLIPLYIKRYFLKKYDVVIVPTKYLASKLNLDNVKVIPFGIDINKFSYVNRSVNKKLVVSYLGAMTYEKGVVDFLEAVKLINDNAYLKHIEFRLYIPNKFRQPKDKPLVKGVEVYGKLDNIAKAYQESDIVVMPHRTEIASIGIPLVMLEAMSCGCLVITTDFKHLKEVGGECVKYIEVGEVGRIVDFIMKYYNKRGTMKQLGKEASKRVSKLYNKELMIKLYKEVYDEI